jgi:Rrf2 family protein
MTKDRSLSSAIQIMVILSKLKDTPVTSEMLATSLCTNPGLVRRILPKLAKANLIETIKGKNGGSRLMRPESRITVEDIYRVVSDGPLFGSFDKEPFKTCNVSCQMGKVLNDYYDDLEKKIMRTMGNMKLSTIVRRIK